MASICISSCVNDARVPVRATYVNLYKWPESDFEFVRSMSANVPKNTHGNMYGHPRVVDSFSCRQLYLRSYTFSREEDYRDDEKIIKCLGRGKVDKTTSDKDKSRKRKSGGGRNKCDNGLRRAKSASCSAFEFVFRRLLSCTTKIDVVN